MPEEVEQRVQDDEEKDDVAEVEDDEVHAVGGDGTAVGVVKHLGNSLIKVILFSAQWMAERLLLLLFKRRNRSANHCASNSKLTITKSVLVSYPAFK